VDRPPLDRVERNPASIRGTITVSRFLAQGFQFWQVGLHTSGRDQLVAAPFTSRRATTPPLARTDPRQRYVPVLFESCCILRFFLMICEQIGQRLSRLPLLSESSLKVDRISSTNLCSSAASWGEHVLPFSRRQRLTGNAAVRIAVRAIRGKYIPIPCPTAQSQVGLFNVPVNFRCFLAIANPHIVQQIRRRVQLSA